MKKLILILICGLFGVVQGATYYIDYVTGSDANNGTSKSTPWKRAPGMHGASNNVLAYQTSHSNAQGTSAAGDSFIFKGGVTWPNDCYVWDWIYGGGTGWSIGDSAIYFGVDTTWYTGGSWSRPIFDAEGKFVVASQYVTNTMCRLYKSVGGYFIVDNLEFKGIYHNDNNNKCMLMLAATVGEIKNCYMHGWIHGPVIDVGPCNSLGDGVTYNICNKWTTGADSGNYCRDLLVVIATTYDIEDQDIRVHHCYIDGSDASPTPGDMANATKGFMKHFYNNYVTHVQNIITNNFCSYVWGNTFIEASRIPDLESSTHHNVYQSYGSSTAAKSYVYNNFVKDVAGGATFLWYPSNNTKFYAFNNVDYNDNNQIFQFGNGSITDPNTAGFYIWNNTVQCATPAYSAVNGSQSGVPFSVFFVKNNHFITGNKIINAGVNSAKKDIATNIIQTNAEAELLNYTVGSTYPLYPPSDSSLTVGTGTDISSIFTELIDSDSSRPSIACLYDATLGVNVDTISHTVSYPKRIPLLRGATFDIGAYEYQVEANKKIIRMVIK